MSIYLRYTTLGMELAEAGDLKGYREHCAKALKRFPNPTDPVAAMSVAACCLILPASGANPEAVARLADIAASAPPKHWAWGLGQDCKALSEYRQGRFAKAEEYSQLVLSRPFNPFDRGRGLYVRIRAQAVLAMASWQLGQSNVARSALAKSMESAKSVPGRSLEPGWEWLFAQGSLREAKALIENQPVMAKDAAK